MAIVFPDPGGPINAKVAPGATENETSSISVRPPRLWVTWLKLMPTGPSGRGSASVGSGLSGRASMTSEMRSMLADVSCIEMTMLETRRDRAVRLVRYVAKATNVPRVMCPLIASQPPTAIFPTRDSCGNDCSAGWNRALSFAARRRREKSSDELRSIFATSLSPCANALTTRMPETVSSTCPAISPACCWAAQVAAWSLSREFTAM